MSNLTDIAQIIDVMSAAFPNFSFTEKTVEIYYQTLNDIPSDELKAATLHCITESGRKFAPSVGEIRGAVSQLRGMSSNVPSSYEAWEEVLQQFRDAGYYRDPVFSHPLIDRAVRSLGWRELCQSENQVSDRMRFIQCYEQLLDRATRENMLLPEVRGYLEVNGARLLSPMDSMKLLADKWSVKK